MQHLSVDKDLLRLYVNDLCSQEQMTVIRQYLSNPAYKQSLDEWMQHHWQEVSGSSLFNTDINAAEQYRQFLSVVQPVSEEVIIRGRRINPRWWGLVAAAVFIGTLVFAGWQWHSGNMQQHAARENHWIHLNSVPGKIDTILLPDSSKVYLSASSTLRYNKNYGTTNRNIHLKGEAYFIVKHEGTAPFTVYTGPVKTVDIGTEFNVRWRNFDPKVRIAVAEGRVDVIQQHNKIENTITSLVRGQQLSFDTVTGKASLRILADDEIAGRWREGIISFRQQPLSKVAEELSEYYGVNIRCMSKRTAGMEVTTLLKHTSLKEALEILSTITGVTIKRTEKEILIK